MGQIRDTDLLESTFSDEAFGVMLGPSGPPNIVSVIVRLSDLLFLLVPNLHTVVKDEDIDRSTLSFVPGHGKYWFQWTPIAKGRLTYVVMAFLSDSTVGMMTPSSPSL